MVRLAFEGSSVQRSLRRQKGSGVKSQSLILLKKWRPLSIVVLAAAELFPARRYVKRRRARLFRGTNAAATKEVLP